jgi:hypothetical protein
VQVNVPAIRDIVGGAVTVATEGQSKSRLSFAGGQHLVFGLQAVRLMYEGGRFVAYKSLPPGSAAKRAAASLTAETDPGGGPNRLRVRTLIRWSTAQGL